MGKSFFFPSSPHFLLQGQGKFGPEDPVTEVKSKLPHPNFLNTRPLLLGVELYIWTPGLCGFCCCLGFFVFFFVFFFFSIQHQTCLGQ